MKTKIPKIVRDLYPVQKRVGDVEKALRNLGKKAEGDDAMMFTQYANSLRRSNDAIGKARDSLDLEATLVRQHIEKLEGKKASTALRVATRHLEASARLDSGTRAKVNRELNRRGMDGNGRFRKPGEALALASEIMRGYDIEFMDPFLGLHGKEGRTTANLVLDGDVIGNSLFSVQWSLGESGRYEVLAYLS